MHLNKWAWLLQFFFVSFGLLEIVGIIIILALFQGHPEPTGWILGITLNSLTTILARSAEAFSAFAQTTIVLQLCYVQFVLYTTAIKIFAIHYSAIRGPSGVIKLILYACRRLLLVTFIAGLIMFITPFTTIFVSQSIASHDQLLVAGRSSVSVAFDYNQSAPGPSSSVRNIPLSMVKAIDTGMLDLPVSKLEPVPECKSGNCSWESFLTGGVEAKCQSLDAQIYCTPRNDQDGPWCDLSLTGGGPSLKGRDQQMEVTASIPPNTGDDFADYPQQFANFKVLRRLNSTSGTAMHCALIANAQRKSATSVNGAYSENTIATMYNSTATFPHSSFDYNEDEYFLIRLKDSPVQFSWSVSYVIAQQLYALNLFQGSKTTTNGDTQYSSDAMRFIDAAMADGTLQDLMDRIALAMTTEMRQGDSDASTAAGDEYRSARIVDFRWPWILPAIIVPFTSIILLVVVRYRSSLAGLPLVSSEVYTPLEVSFEDESWARIDALYNSTLLAKNADDILVRLEDGRLVYTGSAAAANGQPTIPLGHVVRPERPWLENFIPAVTSPFGG